MVLTASASDGTRHSTFVPEAMAFAGDYKKTRAFLTEKYPGRVILSPLEPPTSKEMSFIQVTVFVERVAGSGRLGSLHTWLVEKKDTQ